MFAPHAQIALFLNKVFAKSTKLIKKSKNTLFSLQIKQNNRKIYEWLWICVMQGGRMEAKEFNEPKDVDDLPVSDEDLPPPEMGPEDTTNEPSDSEADTKIVEEEPEKPVVVKEAKHAKRHAKAPTEKTTVAKPKKATKRAVKKIAVKETKKQKKKFSLNPWWIVLIVVVIAVAAWLITNQVLLKNKGTTTTAGIAATINGEEITNADLDAEYARIPAAYQQFITKDALLEQMINEKLLMQEAVKKGITVRDEEVLALIDDQLKLTNTTMDDFKQQLAAQNMTIQEIQDYYKKQLVITMLLNQTVLKDLTSSNDEIRAYYDTNIAEFTTPEQVRARHILVMFGNNTENETFAAIKEVEAELTDKNFCELVTKYSEDPGSKETCGEYTFGKGQMVPEFEDLAFSQDINETGIVKTQFGYHIVQTLEKIPEVVQAYDEVKETISTQLKTELQRTAVQSYLDGLRNTATIKISGKDDASGTANNACYQNYNLTADAVVFYHAESCPYCQRMKPKVQDLEAKGYKFHWAEASSGTGMGVVTGCLQDVIGEGVPEFICLASNEVLMGERSAEDLKKFADDCKKGVK
jgi:peptidyl-prolyl cis-trans isomerase C